MIKIEAIIKPEKANAIGLALEEAGVGGYFLSNISGKLLSLCSLELNFIPGTGHIFAVSNKGFL